MSEHQSQEYRGNGNHTWEEVNANDYGATVRLRVPGGWLYNVHVVEHDAPLMNTVFVPMPEVVKHKV